MMDAVVHATEKGATSIIGQIDSHNYRILEVFRNTNCFDFIWYLFQFVCYNVFYSSFIAFDLMTYI